MGELVFGLKQTFVLVFLSIVLLKSETNMLDLNNSLLDQTKHLKENN